MQANWRTHDRIMSELLHRPGWTGVVTERANVITQELGWSDLPVSQRPEDWVYQVGILALIELGLWPMSEPPAVPA